MNKPVTHKNFAEQLKFFGAERIHDTWIRDSKRKKHLRTWGFLTVENCRSFEIRVEYEQGKVRGVILSHLSISPTPLETAADVDKMIALFQKVRVLKEFVGDQR